MLTRRTEDHDEVRARPFVLTIGVASTASAQAPAAGARVGVVAVTRTLGHPSRPRRSEGPARRALRTGCGTQGMLKGTDERDMVGMLEYQAKSGTIQVDGRAVHAHQVSREYQLPDPQPADQLRLHARERTGLLNIEVVSSQYAWNEDHRAPRSPVRRARSRRCRRPCRSGSFASGPVRRVHRKSALAGTMNTWTLGANPGTVLADGAAKVGDTSVSWDAAGKPVVTSPDPGVPGRPALRRSMRKCMAEKIVGHESVDDNKSPTATTKTGTIALNKSRCLRALPAKEDAVSTRPDDERDEDGHVYVVAPVPPSVQNAMNVTTKRRIVLANRSAANTTTACARGLGSKSRPDRRLGRATTWTATTWPTADER